MEDDQIRLQAATFARRTRIASVIEDMPLLGLSDLQ